MERYTKKWFLQLVRLLLMLVMPALTYASDYPVAFNCVEVGANEVNGHLYTKLSHSVSTIDIVALDESGQQKLGWQSATGDLVAVTFVDGSSAAACANKPSIAIAQQLVSFSAGDNGRKTVQVTWPNIAKRDVMCRVVMQVVGQPSTTSCSRDHFSLRPQEIAINTSAATADQSGIDAAALPIVKAGVAFDLIANSQTTGYDGVPKLDSSKLVAHQGAVQVGELTGQFSQANSLNGQAIAQTSYTEVGYFKLNSFGVFDDEFTAIDAKNGDCVLGFVHQGQKPACYFGNATETRYFGRFVPNHFSLSVDVTESACHTGFTYYGQEGLTTRFRLTARNNVDQVTQNYTDQFARFNLANWDGYQFSASGLPPGSALTVASQPPTGVWQDGIADAVAQHVVTRANNPSAPAAIQFNMAALDSDGVTMAPTTIGQASELRYGRLNLSNAYGSELLSLPFTVEAQYWNGNVYIRNSLDSCTTIPLASIAMSNYKKNLSACETALSGAGLMQQGQVALSLAAPGAGNNGSTELQINLAVASGATCIPNSMPAISADMSWFGANPYANATFGVFKSPVVYMRENF